MLTPENESSNLHLTYRENRMSDASSVFKILPVKGVLFSTSVEVRVLIPSVVRLCPSTNSGSVREHFSRRTALRIFLIFCMNVPYYKQKKRTRPFFRENSCSLIIHENMLKNGLFNLLVCEHFSRITVLRIFLIFCMNVPYHKGKKRTRRFFRENSGSLIIHENVSKIMVFGHFFEDYWWDLPKNAHEYSLDDSLRPCIGCWVSKNLEVCYFAYWLSQYA